MLQIEVRKTAGILDVFQGFPNEKLRQKIRRFVGKEFLEVPDHLAYEAPPGKCKIRGLTAADFATKKKRRGKHEKEEDDLPIVYRPYVKK